MTNITETWEPVEVSDMKPGDRIKFGIWEFTVARIVDGYRIEGCDTLESGVPFLLGCDRNTEDFRPPTFTNHDVRQYMRKVQPKEPASFEVGDLVTKPKGYPFPGKVVSIFPKLDGELRVVVESIVAPGLLHIFAPNQLEAA